MGPSRRGQPKRFVCPSPGCGKQYSRAEHLARHGLNHNPKSVYRCDEDGCDRTFVRADLMCRHKERHAELSREPSLRRHGRESCVIATPDATFNRQSANSLPARSQSLDFASRSDQPVIMTGTRPQANEGPQPVVSPSSIPYQPAERPQTVLHDIVPQSYECSEQRTTPCNQQVIYARREVESRLPLPTITSPTIPVTSNQHHEPCLNEYINANPNTGEGYITSTDFASWLFDNDDTFRGLGSNDLSFLDYGSTDVPFGGIDLGSDIGSIDNLTCRLEIPTPPQAGDTEDTGLTENRIRDLVDLIRTLDPRRDSGLPDMGPKTIQICVQAFWDHIAPQIPIVHTGTFSINECNTLLLLTIVTLGAAAAGKSKGNLNHASYSELAFGLASPLRWKIITHEDAQPPAEIWVMQTLLLLEVYEKTYSTRSLHERSHVYHSVTLNLIRRGDPLVGCSRSHSPEHQGPSMSSETRPVASSTGGMKRHWHKWIRQETICRIVFVAFMMDITHAIMFGHSLDMFPQEIQIRLPHDDALWTAPSITAFHNAQVQLRMYGISPMDFLDGLKSSLHGHSIETHPFARKVLMCGLMSVAWCTNRREVRQRSLDALHRSPDTNGWRKLLFHAFQKWLRSFRAALGHHTSSGNNSQAGSLDASTSLSFLAHLSMHSDVIDLQIFAGCTQLLGRRVSNSERTKALQRVDSWTQTSVATQLAYESLKILYETLVLPGTDLQPQILYSAMYDHDTARPWLLYLAGLTFYAFTLKNAAAVPPATTNEAEDKDTSDKVCDYLIHCADLQSLEDLRAEANISVCADVLSVLHDCLNGTTVGILQEACDRLSLCHLTLTERIRATTG